MFAIGPRLCPHATQLSRRVVGERKRRNNLREKIQQK
jgi:hypothetical protein